jgi:hypothetical protein
MAEKESGPTGVMEVAERRKVTVAADQPTDSAAVEAKDNRSPAEIEADLDRTRARLSATLDELSEQLTPRELARRSGQAIKATFVEPQTGKLRPRPVAAALGGLGATLALGTLFAAWKVRGRSA